MRIGVVRSAGSNGPDPASKALIRLLESLGNVVVHRASSDKLTPESERLMGQFVEDMAGASDIVIVTVSGEVSDWWHGMLRKRGIPVISAGTEQATKLLLELSSGERSA